jgi:hypothetical protein
MPSNEMVTRKKLTGELVKNASTKPLTIAVPAAVVVTGLLLHTIWLVPVALVVYAALFAATLFDGNEAERIGQRTYERARESQAAARALETSKLSPRIQQAFEAAREQERQIEQAIEQANLPFDDVTDEVDNLMSEMEKIARKAQIVDRYLATENSAETQTRLRQVQTEARGSSGATAEARERAAQALEDQLNVQRELEGELDRFFAEMEHLDASLGAIHGQIVRMSVAEESSMQNDIAGQVRELRERVSTLADGFGEAFGKLPSTA